MSVFEDWMPTILGSGEEREGTPAPVRVSVSKDCMPVLAFLLWGGYN